MVYVREEEAEMTMCTDGPMTGGRKRAITAI